MTAVSVSIITPTCNRARFMPRIAHCVLSQKVDWEWHVLDDSAAPDPYMESLAARDPRVHYRHSPDPISIGAKRNAMIEAARAPFIAHFDDDDIYGPDYLARMLEVQRHTGVDMLKLSGFFLYAPASDFFGYLDLTAVRGWHYELTKDGYTTVNFSGEKEPGKEYMVFYGFSYLYRREPALAQPYLDISLFEDARFAQSWINGGYSMSFTSYATRECLHWIHPTATARSYSAYRIPSFLLPQLFPVCAELRDAYPQAVDRPGQGQ
jgi:glycosyltransferase involved in cell wall biosynthesis